MELKNALRIYTTHAVRQQTDLDTMNGVFRDANIQVDD